VKDISDHEAAPAQRDEDKRGSERAAPAVDHSLPIHMAEEIFRMRLRLSAMPTETKGIVAINNAIGRLEDELNMKGYSIEDLTGQPYMDEMTITVREFVSSDDMRPGERKILRMLRPRVKYKNIIVSYGEVEVAMSPKDMAQKP
jgi:hypothetical protein